MDTPRTAGLSALCMRLSATVLFIAALVLVVLDRTAAAIVLAVAGFVVLLLLARPHGRAGQAPRRLLDAPNTVRTL